MSLWRGPHDGKTSDETVEIKIAVKIEIEVPGKGIAGQKFAPRGLIQNHETPGRTAPPGQIGPPGRAEPLGCASPPGRAGWPQGRAERHAGFHGQ